MSLSSLFVEQSMSYLPPNCHKLDEESDFTAKYLVESSEKSDECENDKFLEKNIGIMFINR